MKQLLLILFVALFGTFAANAVTPKGPAAKTTDAVAAPAESKTQTGITYYWFPVDASGNLLPARQAKTNAQSATDPDGCDGSSSRCGLAFTPTQTHMDGSGNVILNSTVSQNSYADESLKD